MGQGRLGGEGSPGQACERFSAPYKVIGGVPQGVVGMPRGPGFGQLGTWSLSTTGVAIFPARKPRCKCSTGSQSKISSAVSSWQHPVPKSPPCPYTHRKDRRDDITQEFPRTCRESRRLHTFAPVAHNHVEKGQHSPRRLPLLREDEKRRVRRGKGFRAAAVDVVRGELDRVVAVGNLQEERKHGPFTSAWAATTPTGRVPRASPP